MSRPKEEKNKTITTLEKLGLTENEAVLYEVILGIGSATAQEIVIRSPFTRTMLYHILDKLLERGLISLKKDKSKSVYTAEDPEHLYDILAKKEKEFKEEQIAIRSLVPKLKHSYLLAGKRTSVRTFDGMAEYKKVLEDIIISKPKGVLSYRMLEKKKTGAQVWNAFDKRRVTKKIDEKVLFFESKKSLRALLKYKYNDFTHFRGVADTDTDKFEVEFSIYGNKILYTNFNDKYEPTAVLIEDENLAQMQKSLFMSVWNTGKDRTLYFTEEIT